MPDDREILLIGAAAIAEFLQLSRRRVYELTYRKKLPVFNLGGRKAARPEALRQHFAKLEREAVNDS